MNKVFFKTSDGNIFYTQNAADNHAKTLSNRTVVSIPPIGGPKSLEETAVLNNEKEPNEVLHPIEDEATEESSTETEGTDETAPEEGQSEMAEDLDSVSDEEMDLMALTNDELKKIAADMGLSFKPRATKAELVELINNAPAQ